MFYDVSEVANRIKEIRKSRNITQEKIAELLNLSENQIYKIESGKSGCTLDNVIIISEVLNVSIDYLLLGKNQDLQMSSNVEKLIYLLSECPEEQVEFVNKIVNTILENISLIKKE